MTSSDLVGLAIDAAIFLGKMLWETAEEIISITCLVLVLRLLTRGSKNGP